LTQKDADNFLKKWKQLSQVLVPPVSRIDGSTKESEIADAFGISFKNML
jgi:hypothetical protein